MDLITKRKERLRSGCSLRVLEGLCDRCYLVLVGKMSDQTQSCRFVELQIRCRLFDGVYASAASFPLHLFDILIGFRYNRTVGHPHFCSFAWKAFPL